MMGVLSTLFGVLFVVFGIGGLSRIEYTFRVRTGLLTATFAIGVILGSLWAFVILSGG